MNSFWNILLLIILKHISLFENLMKQKVNSTGKLVIEYKNKDCYKNQFIKNHFTILTTKFVSSLTLNTQKIKLLI